MQRLISKFVAAVALCAIRTSFFITAEKEYRSLFRLFADSAVIALDIRFPRIVHKYLGSFKFAYGISYISGCYQFRRTSTRILISLSECASGYQKRYKVFHVPADGGGYAWIIEVR